MKYIIMIMMVAGVCSADTNTPFQIQIDAGTNTQFNVDYDSTLLTNMYWDARALILDGDITCNNDISVFSEGAEVFSTIEPYNSITINADACTNGFTIIVIGEATNVYTLIDGKLQLTTSEGVKK